MDNQGLIGFLQNKSIFNKSPKTNRKRSKSRDGKDSIIRKINDKQLDNHEIRNSRFQKEQPTMEFNSNLTFQDRTKMGNDEPLFKKAQSRIIDPSQRYMTKNPEDRTSFNNQFTDNFNTNSNRFGNFNDNSQKQPNIFTAMASYATQFESARVESAQCLQSLSLRLNTEISSINYRIEQFRNSISRILTKQLKLLKENIMKLVEIAFNQSQKSIREYIHQEEQKLSIDVFKVREMLEKEYIKVQTMKEQINRPQWRKVAGQILATDLQKRVEDTLRLAKNTEIKQWRMKDINGQRLKSLEEELKSLVRLKD